MGPDPIVIKTTDRLAGAIDSLVWRGVEFIDSADHGRQLQSACSFNACGNEPFWAEAYNPTEAGTRLDGAGATSSSKLLSIESTGSELTTRTQMAFWLAPHEKSPRPNAPGVPARNRSILSNTFLKKKVTLGLPDLSQAIRYDVEFEIAADEGCPDQPFSLAQMEVLTGYMPPAFSKFFTWNPKDGTTAVLSEGPGEQPLPIIFATETMNHAMGVYAPKQEERIGSGPSYGRWFFRQDNVVKWNCVYRIRAKDRIEPGKYSYRVYVAVGDFEQVKSTLSKLVAMQAQ